MYATATALPPRWFTRADSTMPVYTGSWRWMNPTRLRMRWSEACVPSTDSVAADAALSTAS